MVLKLEEDSSDTSQGTGNEVARAKSNAEGRAVFSRLRGASREAAAGGWATRGRAGSRARGGTAARNDRDRGGARDLRDGDGGRGRGIDGSRRPLDGDRVRLCVGNSGEDEGRGDGGELHCG
jgi:hypothetical protein